MAHMDSARRSNDMSLPQEVACRLSNVLNSKPIEAQVNNRGQNRIGSRRNYFIEATYNVERLRRRLRRELSREW